MIFSKLIRWINRPYIYFQSLISFFKRGRKEKKVKLSPGDNVLLVRLDRLGDVVMTTSLIDALKKQYPQISIDMAVSSESAPLFIKDERVSNIIALDVPWHVSDPSRKWRESAMKLRDTQYDLAIDVRGDTLDSYVAFLARAKHTLGFLSSRSYARNLYDYIPPYNKGLLSSVIQTASDNTNIARLRYLAEFLNCSVEGFWPKLHADETVSSFLKNNGSLHIALHPGTIDKEKKWHRDNFVALVSKLEKNFPKSNFYIIGSDSEQEDADYIEDQLVKGGVQGIYNLCGQTSLAELAVSLKNINLLIANDSGPLHIANAFKRPIVGLFLRKYAARYGVLNRGVVITPPEKRDNINSIHPEKVWEACNTILNNISSGDE